VNGSKDTNGVKLGPVSGKVERYKGGREDKQVWPKVILDPVQVPGFEASPRHNHHLQSNGHMVRLIMEALDKQHMVSSPLPACDKNALRTGRSSLFHGPSRARNDRNSLVHNTFALS